VAPESKSFNHDIRQLFHGKRQQAYRILFDVIGDKVRVLQSVTGRGSALNQSPASRVNQGPLPV
jgi:hypothetical protein